MTNQYGSWTNVLYVFTWRYAAILVSQNNETATMFVSQTSPVGVELFSYVNVSFNLLQ